MQILPACKKENRLQLNHRPRASENWPSNHCPAAHCFHSLKNNLQATSLWPSEQVPHRCGLIAVQGHKATLNGAHIPNMIYGDTLNTYTALDMGFTAPHTLGDP